MNKDRIQTINYILMLLGRVSIFLLIAAIPFEEADALYKISLIVFFASQTIRSLINTPVSSKIKAGKKTLIIFLAGIVIYFIFRGSSPITAQISDMPEVSASFFMIIWYFLSGTAFLVFSFYLISDEFKIAMVEGKDFTRFSLMRVLLNFMFALLVLSCFTSLFPQTSFKYFWREMGLYIWITLVLWKDIEDFKQIKALIFCGAAIAVVIGIIGTAEFFIYKLGSDTIRQFLLSHEWIRAEKYTHIQFPFNHHNRMASYCMLGTLQCVICLFFIKPGIKRITAIIFSTFPFIAMMLTLNRGAFVSFSAAFLLMMILMRPKRLLVFPIVLLIIFILLPAVSQERFSSIFSKDTYTEKKGTFYLRKVAWIAAGKIIADHPFLGIGFSYKNQAKIYNLYAKDDIEDKTHCHNNYLELAVETGIVNTLIFLFLIYNLYAGLVCRWRDMKRLYLPVSWSICFITILTGIVVYGLVNYSLRYTIGTMVFIVLGIILGYLKISEPVIEKVESAIRPL